MNLSIYNSKIIAVDTETTGINPYGKYGASLFAVSICDLEGNTVFERFEVNPYTRRVNYRSNEKGFGVINSLLSNRDIDKVFFNTPFDLRMLEKAGFKKVRGKIYDAWVMIHIVTGGKEPTYKLKKIAKKYLDFDDLDERELHKSVARNRIKAKKLKWKIADETISNKPIQADYWLGSKSLLRKYAIQDVERTILLYEFCRKEINKDKGLRKTLTRENSVRKVLARAEKRGIEIDLFHLDKLVKFYEKEKEKQEIEADKAGGKGLNFNSPKQMIEMFYVQRKHPEKINVKTGKLTLDKWKLAEIARTGDKLAEAIIKYKAADHANSSFLLQYRRFAVKENGIYVIHPSFRQVGAATGRISSAQPNLLNVVDAKSSMLEYAVPQRVKEVFKVREKLIWYLFDYSQIELLLAAFFSEEKELVDMILNGKDIMQHTSDNLWGSNDDYESKRLIYREKAKQGIYAKLYGAGANKLSLVLNITYSEAMEFISNFAILYPNLDRMMQRLINQVSRTGEIRNAFGRVYYIHPTQAYLGVNYFIQGTALEILKRAMVRCYYDLMIRDYKDLYLLLPIHDELIFEAPQTINPEILIREIIKRMQADSSRLGLGFPLPIKVKSTVTNWAEAQKVIMGGVNVKKGSNL